VFIYGTAKIICLPIYAPASIHYDLDIGKYVLDKKRKRPGISFSAECGNPDFNLKLGHYDG
jgi:hypothetical protein